MQDTIAALFSPQWRAPALWCAAALTVGLFWLLGRACRRFFAPALARLLSRRGRGLPAVLADSFAAPAVWWLFLLGLRLAAELAPVGAAVPAFFHRFFRLGCIVLLGWGLTACGELSVYLLRNVCKRLDVSSGRSVVSFLSSLFKGVVWALVVVIGLSELGYDVNGLVAGLGLGGLTVALAAQDSAANFFAGRVLQFERPLEVGDYITYGELSGTVEAIDFRATRLRTMADTVITVPNSTLCAQPITNWTRMRSRLVRFTVGLRYDTAPQTVERILAEIADMLRQNKAILPKTVHVNLEKFGDSSLDVLVRYCIGEPDFEHQFVVNQEVNLAILRIVHDCGSDFAFPSRSLYVEPAAPPMQADSGE